MSQEVFHSGRKKTTFLLLEKGISRSIAVAEQRP